MEHYRLRYPQELRIMKLVVRKSRLKGEVEVPASKSHTIRAVTIGSLASGQSLIHRP
ncbi:MAG: hypothetical protein ACYSUC_08380, partial [Planctomycetota bacterium]